MTTVLILFRVANYDEWRPRYDSAVERTIGIESAQVWRGQDDPDLVAVAEVFAGGGEGRPVGAHPDPQRYEAPSRRAADPPSGHSVSARTQVCCVMGRRVPEVLIVGRPPRPYLPIRLPALCDSDRARSGCS